MPTSAGSPGRVAAGLILLAFGALVGGCAESPAPDASTSAATPPGPLVVCAVNYPLAYFAERIGGDAVDVHLPVPAGVDPATWSPDAATITSYQGADLILLNGAGYAAWVGRATLPAGKLVDTSAKFADRYLTVDDAVTHTHGPEGEHDHGDVAFTTWLDPTLAALQAAAVRDALIEARPDNEDGFRSRYAELAADLSDIEDGLRAVFAMLGGQPVLFSHPVYQYLERRYELNAGSLHWEPDQVLTDADLKSLAEVLATHPARILIWEVEPMPETLGRLEALGVSNVVYDPCANRPEDGDYLACMRANLGNMEAML